jgi:amino acid adenylation domain-containing protein
VRLEKVVHHDVNAKASQHREAWGNNDADVSGPNNLLEKIPGGAGEPSVPFGLVRGERRIAKRATLKLESDLAARLHNQAVTLGISMESLVCLAWSLVLARFCGQDRVTFGVALPAFAKAVPVRVVTANRSAEAALRDTHESLTEVRTSLPVREADLQNGDSGAADSLSALFGYGLPEENAWNEELSGGVWPLAVLADERGETLLISTWAQNPADPTRVGAYVRTALERLAGILETAPDTLTASIDVMPEQERHKLLVEWNASYTAHPRDKCVHELFEEQAARTPNAVAVVHDGRTLTYSQLNARANRLAHYLRGLGIGPEALVAICVDRSLEMVVGLLAILKAGGAYVPLDPAYPVQRLSFMLNDSDPAVLLVDGMGRSVLENITVRAQIIDVAGETLLWADEPETELDVSETRTLPENLAYIIYTSGSTGTPKGVMIEHANVARLFSATAAWFNFRPDDVWTLFHSFAFDFSVWEIWGALFYGGRLLIVPKITAQNPGDFYQFICDAGVTVLNQTPSAFRQLMAAQGSHSAQHRLRLVIFGGEALETSSLKPWFERDANQHTQLINMYGITETTVHVTYYPLKPADAERRGASPIGCGIPDLRVYILDSNGQPAPIGVTGELHVGGAGVARGYLSRPTLTAERFLADPFSAEPGARMYKAGDLGRWTADGMIEYLGRNDFQVKIRGFRIELGEIEARVAEFEGISEVHVIAREDSPGDKRLVAYYVASASIRAQALRAHLLPTLPEYMVPAAYVSLDRMPLTHNGKLDLKALPAPDSRAYALDAYEMPVGPVEEKLARLWVDVLGLDRISRNANFFDLGGDSLLAYKLLVLVEKEFGRSLNLTSVFGAPSIAALGQLLHHGGSPSKSSPHLVYVQPMGSKPPLFAILDPGMYQNISRHLGDDQPVIGLQLFNPREPLESKYSRLEDAASECVKLLREVQPHGPYSLIGWCVAGVLAFEVAQQLVQMGHKVSFIGIVDGWAPDYIRRRGKSWLKACEYAFRWKRDYADWRAGRRSVTSLIKPLRWLRRAPRADANPVASDPVLAMIKNFSEEMYAYLWRLQSTYVAKTIPARIHIFVSQYRPTGWLANSSLGWDRLAREGAVAATFEGDHWSFFNEPGAGQSAAHIAAALTSAVTRAPSKAPSDPATARTDWDRPPPDPLVSIIIPAYNAEHDIARAIRCAISQTYREIEIIVADDGSQDGTVQTARETLKIAFKGRWSVLELGVNRGPSAARNAAVRHARGEWIQFLDSDDAIAADKIEMQMKCALAAGTDLSAIYSSCRHVYLENGDFVPAGPVNSPQYEGKHPLMFCMFYASLHHGACLIRRSALERVQGFDESLRSYEDADLLVRLAKETGRFQFVPSNQPSYLWRLYREQVRESDTNSRYILKETAMNWIKVVKNATGSQQIGDILSFADDMVIWRQHCTSYARRLVESDNEAFTLFMDELRSVDSDFALPQA